MKECEKGKQSVSDRVEEITVETEDADVKAGINLLKRPQGSMKSPDGGYGWAIVAATFVGHGLLMYTLRAVGVLFVDFREEFQVSYANLNLLYSLLVGTLHIAAPLTSILGNRFGSRVTVMIGGLLQTIGPCVAAFSPSMGFTHFSLGFLTGLGLSLSSIPFSVEIGRYFTTKRPLALGIQQIGPSIFAMIAPPMTQYLIEEYGWRGALIITGVLNLNTVACGAILRPIILESDVKAQDVNGKKRMINWSLFRSCKFNLYMVALALSSPALFFFSFYIVAFALLEQNFTEYESALLLSVCSFCGIGSRPMTGLLTSYTRVRCFPLMTALKALLAVCYFVYPFVRSYWSAVFVMAMSGIALGGISPLAISGLAEIVGPTELMSAFGLQGITGAPTTILAQPFAGWLSDVFGTLRAAFFLAFIMMGLSSLLLLVYCLFFDKDQNTEKSDNQSTDKTE